MFENVVAGWKLGSAVRKIVFQDKKLLMFPILSGIVIFLEALAVFVPMLLLRSFFSLFFIAALFVYYIIVYFTSVYVLVAMVIAFRSFKTKEPLGVVAALSRASAYTVQIFEWAVFEAVVTMIIRLIEERLGRIGAIIFGFVATLALSAATLFAIPIIVDKKMGPISTLKESVGFIMKNFGKTFGGLAFSELYALMFILAGIGVMVVGAVLTSILPILGVAVAVLGLILFVLGGMLSYVLSNIYRFVLYDYMNGGTLPEGISKEMVDASVKTQKRRGILGRLGGGSGSQGM